MMMLTSRQMAEMRERAADREVEREERRLHLEEQREDRRMQMQIQQQFMNTMLVMMTGRVGVPPVPLPQVPPVRNLNIDESQVNNGQGQGEGKTPQ